MLHPSLVASSSVPACPIHLVPASDLSGLMSELGAVARGFLEATGYKATPGRVALLPADAGGIAGAVMGVDGPEARNPDPFLASRLPAALPEGVYAFASAPANPTLATLAFVLGTYRFGKYRKVDAPPARLVVPAGVDGERVSRIAAAIGFGRDLINTPTSDLGPDALAAAAIATAGEFGADVEEIAGKKLLKKNFPMIHAVGRASAEEPRLVDITWGNPRHPKVTLVGKGVCFDTGGLDIKPDTAMLLMKKDMGGAAAALAAARMIMGGKLKVRLRVLLSIVENSISANAFRPGDVLRSRKGLTVEIGNTDAEGRLVLGDALAYADEEAPDLLVDFATLTGAARVALGQELPPFFTDDDRLAQDIEAMAMAENDPVWRLPLWRNYESLLDSKVADINNTGSGGMAGSITAALFLKKFVEQTKSYVHFDIYGWALSEKGGLPMGGNPQCARLIHALVEKRFGR